MSTHLAVPLGDAARKHLTCDITVTVTGRRRFDARVWLALRILRLAAFVLPMPANVAIDTKVR